MLASGRFENGFPIKMTTDPGAETGLPFSGEPRDVKAFELNRWNGSHIWHRYVPPHVEMQNTFQGLNGGRRI